MKVLVRAGTEYANFGPRSANERKDNTLTRAFAAKRER